MSTTATIRRVSYREIMAATNAPDLLAEYAAECSVPVDLQAQTYELMERLGALQCFGVFKRPCPQEEPVLVGFASVLTAVMPHNGLKIATVESIFISADHRSGGIGTALLGALEDHAGESGCMVLHYNVRMGSRLAQVLERRCGCAQTHAVYSRRLQ